MIPPEEGRVRNVLLVEDDHDDQEFIKEAFAKADPSLLVNVVSSGKEALLSIDKAGPDELPCLILLDYNMPEMNGVELLKKVNASEKYRNISKVVFSTAKNEAYKQQSLQEGANAYIVKPHYFHELVTIISEIIAVYIYHK